MTDMKTTILLLIGTFFIFPLLSAREIVVADGGTALAGIVAAPGNQVARFAAAELKKHLKEMTGADFTISEKPEKKVNFFLGFGDGSGFQPEEFVISAQGNRIDLYGRDASFIDVNDLLYRKPWKGTATAVWHFLQESGVRWFHPGPGGTVVPRIFRLTVKEGTRRYKPSFSDRQATLFSRFEKMYAETDGKAWGTPDELRIWALRNKASARTTAAGCHTEQFLGLDRTAAWLAHPERCALDNTGERNPRYSCWSDPAVAELWWRAADACFSGRFPEDIGLTPSRTRFWPARAENEFMIDPMDHGWRVDGRCYCERCKEFRKTHPCADDTELMWHVIVQVAEKVRKKYPDKFISTLVYPPKIGVPRLVKIPDNVRVRLCVSGGPRLMLSPVAREYELGRLSQWKKITGKKVPLWSYQCSVHGRRLAGPPETYPSLTAKFLKMIEPDSAGMFYEMRGLSYAQIQPDQYVVLQLLYDNTLDPERLLDEYFDGVFGPAAAPMRRLWKRFESNWIRIWCELHDSGAREADFYPFHQSRCEQGMEYIWNNIYTPQEIAGVAKAVEVAERAASGTPYAAAVERVKKYVCEPLVLEREKSQRIRKESKKK